MLRQHSFQSVQATAPDPHALSAAHERVQRKEPLLLQQQLQIFNLLRRHRHNNSSKAHEADQSCSLQYRLPRIAGLIDMHERISRKQRNRDDLLPVAPRVMFGQQWQVDFAALVVKLCDDPFLKSVPRLYRKPLWRGGLYYRLRLWPAGNVRRRDSIATAH